MIQPLPRLWLLFAALGGFAGVAAGAAASHALEGRAAALAATGSQYAIYHALALLALCALTGKDEKPKRLLVLSGWLFILGTLLFSGSLFAVAWSGEPGWTRFTPFGGGAFLLGWAALGAHAVVALRR